MALYRCFAWLTLLLLGVCSGAAAQDSRAERDADATHVGPVTGAVAGVEVTDASGVVRRGVGLFVRCDGYLLIPSWLYMTADGKEVDTRDHQTTVWLNPGAEDTRAIRLGRIRLYYPRDFPYLVIRLDDVHVPAARLLLPDTLRADQAVQMVTCAWDPAAKRFGHPQTRDARLRERAKDEKRSSQSIAFAEPVDGLIPGAPVVGPDGMAVGVVTALSGGQAGAFTTFAAFNLASNCVTPVPVPDDAFAGEADMARIKAGRVAVPAAILREQQDMGSVRTACVRSFLMDRREVTNEEYYAFWQAATGQAVRQPGTRGDLYPTGWEVTGTPFPAEAANLPVLGVPLTGAAAYARWVGKRLPTPFEWALAAFGPGGEAEPPEWVPDYLRDRSRLWDEVRDVHRAFLAENPDLWSDTLFLGSRYTLPWIALPVDLQSVTDWSKRVIERALTRLCTDWRDPHLVLPGGTRRYDRTPERVEDLLLNAWEIVAPPRPFPIQRPSYYVGVQWPRRAALPNEQWRTQALGSLLGVDALPPLSRLLFRLVRSPSDDELLAASALSEAAGLLIPPQRMVVAVGSELQSGITAWAPSHGLSSFSRPPGLTAWSQLPLRYRREMGREVPLHTQLPSMTSGQNMQYCLPVGFRCVR